MGNTETTPSSPPQSSSELRKSIMATSTTTMSKANRLPQPDKGELENEVHQSFGELLFLTFMLTPWGGLAFNLSFEVFEPTSQY